MCMHAECNYMAGWLIRDLRDCKVSVYRCICVDGYAQVLGWQAAFPKRFMGFLSGGTRSMVRFRGKALSMRNELPPGTYYAMPEAPSGGGDELPASCHCTCPERSMRSRHPHLAIDLMERSQARTLNAPIARLIQVELSFTQWDAVPHVHGEQAIGLLFRGRDGVGYRPLLRVLHGVELIAYWEVS